MSDTVVLRPRIVIDGYAYVRITPSTAEAMVTVDPEADVIWVALWQLVNMPDNKLHIFQLDASRHDKFVDTKAYYVPAE
jgi:hypothetical protein